MKALRLQAWKSEPELVEVPDPEPGPGDVVVKVGGAGACHSDLHLMHDFEPGQLPWGPPFTLGHENAGWVHRIGEGVAGFEVGEPVAVYGPWGCGRCERCLAGVETYCLDVANAPVPGGGGGLGADGGMAEYMLVPAAQRHLVRLPDGLEPVHAAPLTDAALTPYHAVRRSWPKLGPRSSAVVIGVGGLGHLAVQVLKATTAARVVAVDTREEALKSALAHGADDAVRAGDGAAEQVLAATRGGADVVIDCVGNDATLRLGAAVTRQLGDLTIVGIGGGVLPVGFFTVPYEVSIQTTYWGSRPELEDVLALAARGFLKPEIRTYSLDEAPQAYRDLTAGTLQGRAVVVP
jgi:propanol-preferring alcohol dehydrogenase